MRRGLMLRALAGFAGARLFGRKRSLALGWDVTHRCNRRCLYCGFDRLSADELDTVGALQLIDQMAAAGAVRLHLSGGEPMLREDIGELIARIAQRGLSCALNTNGHRVAQRIDELRGVDALRLSYDGPAEVHDALRGAGAHKEMLAALAAARAQGLRVVLNVTLSSRNVGLLDELLEFAAQQRALIKFQPAFPSLAYGREIDDLLPSPEQLRAAVQRLRQLRRANRLIVNSAANLEYYLRWPDAPRIPCVAGLLYARIDPLGRLYPCSMKMSEPLMRDSRTLGFDAAFAGLPAVSCADCICPPTLELNMLYALNWRSLLNLGRYF